MAGKHTIKGARPLTPLYERLNAQVANLQHHTKTGEYLPGDERLWRHHVPRPLRPSPGLRGPVA